MSEDNKKMHVWNHACKTDPSATKDNKQGGRQSTSINGIWPVKKATELWGPLGVNWGYEILKDEMVEGIPIMSEGDSPTVLCMTKTHVICLRLWHPGCKDGSGVIQFGDTPYIYKSKWGASCDQEVHKKSLTDALKKCLSLLGFCADIYMGEFDDRDYVEQRKNEESMERADNKIDEKATQDLEYKTWFDNHIEILKTAASMNELETVFKGIVRKMNLRKDEKGIHEATKAKDARKEQLELAKN